MFSFRYLQTAYGIEGRSDADKASVLDSFFKRREQTWNSLYSTNRHGLGTEKIDQAAIRVTLPNFVTPDTTLPYTYPRALKDEIRERTAIVMLRRPAGARMIPSTPSATSWDTISN